MAMAASMSSLVVAVATAVSASEVLIAAETDKMAALMLL
jgi:hypothetical protein